MGQPRAHAEATDVRLEEDLLGQREIPADVYWGVHTLRATENFQLSGVPGSAIPEFVRAMVLVKKAVATANHKLGVLPEDIARAIIAACDDILSDERRMDQFPIDVIQGGAGTSLNMNVNEVIANVALEHLGHAKGRYDIVNPNDHVNKSQSTNDAYPTGLRIALYRSSQKLRLALEGLADDLAAKATEFDGVLKMGRTQLQDAVPMTLGQEFRAFSRMLRSEIAHLQRRDDQLLEV
ncbi:MAG TPA: lyase family protein, partial [Actinomycetaceae bacterium]|nr:lyase family protein [Actinomycetaceae bacterium]